MFIVLLLGSEGDHAQHEVVAAVRTGGALLLRRALRCAYTPWGEDVASRVGVELGDLTFALFDGLFVAGQAAERYDASLVERAVDALHALAEGIRAGS